jgi:hypothetical protein
MSIEQIKNWPKVQECDAILLTRQAVYINCNIAALSCNHFCLGKAIIIKYHECVSVASVIQDKNQIFFVPCCIVIYGLCDCTSVFHVIS